MNICLFRVVTRKQRRDQGREEEGEKRAHGDDVGITHDGVGEREREHDLELERRDVPVHGDLLERVQEAEVALGGHFGRRGDCGG